MEKLVVISGAAGNLGQAVTLKFLENGYRVVALTQPGHPHQSAVLQQAARQSSRLETRELDGFDAMAAEQLVSRYPDAEAAVLLVGGFAMGGVEETDEQLIDKMILLNFKSAYLLARPFFLQMKRRGGGRIVLVGARPAVEANAGKGVLAYAVSKTMVGKLADLLNVEGRAFNVITSVIVPSIIDTPPNRASMPDANFDNWTKPEEIAEVIAFACSPAAAKLDEPVFKIYAHQ